jgi:hypothetical protein
MIASRARLGFDVPASDGRAALPRAIARLSKHVPTPVLVSATATRVVRDYVQWWITHPDPAGRFARASRWLRPLPPRLRRWLMLRVGYDGLIYIADDAVVGHVFFQRRGDALHGFSTAVGEHLDGGGLSVVMMFDFLTFAAEQPGIVKARIGTGRNNTTRRFLERVKASEAELGWRVEFDGWVWLNASTGRFAAAP